MRTNSEAPPESNRRIELHAVHLLPLVATDKGP